MNSAHRKPKPLLSINLTDGINNSLLRGFSWQWQRGEQWGLIGANGSGKTLLLRMIAGDLVMPPQQQQHLEYGFRAGDDAPSDHVEIVSLERQREIMENFNFYAQMRWNSIEEETTPTLADFLSQDAPILNAARRRTVAALGLCHLLDRRLAELSNGESRRALLALALLRRPKLLLLDSPFLGLDPESVRLCHNTLAAAAKTGSTHILFAAVRENDLPKFARKNVLRLSDAAPCAAKTSPQTPKLTAPKKIVELKRVSITYGATRIFKNFSWTIHEGERWLLRGANGSGKSTLIALMLGDHPQSYSNEVRLFGRLRGTGETLWQIKKRIGWISPELHISIDAAQTVLDTVLSGFDDSPYSIGRHNRKQRASASAALAKFGLHGTENNAFGTLSSGAQRLALLARAFVKTPPLLLLDEPCQNLDDANTRLVLDAVDAFCAATPRAAIVYVTHRARAVPASITNELRLKR